MMPPEAPAHDSEEDVNQTIMMPRFLVRRLCEDRLDETCADQNVIHKSGNRIEVHDLGSIRDEVRENIDVIVMNFSRPGRLPNIPHLQHQCEPPR